jgi:hypothetical protein
MRATSMSFSSYCNDRGSLNSLDNLTTETMNIIFGVFLVITGNICANSLKDSTDDDSTNRSPKLKKERPI